MYKNLFFFSQDEQVLLSNKAQSYSIRLYNSSIAAVINGKLVTEVLALPLYSSYAI